jgi:serine/threonine protein kinase
MPLMCGPYRVLASIGSGGMGTVYEALDTRLGRLVALKRLHPHIAENSAASRRFLREGRAAARIRHPHVVQVLALGTEDGTPYLAMELLEGNDLAALLETHGPLSVADALDHVLPVIAAVCAAHAAKVVHRDLKPSNVFVGRGPGGHPWPKVVDFGVSAILEAGDSNQGTGDGLVGTLAYLPPEQALGQSNGSFAGDQYALAVLLYECVTGATPFVGATAYEVLHSVLTAEVVAPSRRAKDVPPEFDAVVARAMSREPGERFPSLREFGAALLPMGSDRSRWSWSPELLSASFEKAPDSGRRKRSRATTAMAPLTATIDSARPAEPPSSERGASEGPQVHAYDGVAIVPHGDMVSILWKAPARSVRARWLFNEIDRAIASLPGRDQMTLMIILPSSAPPDRTTAIESTVRVRDIVPSMRKIAVVIVGDSVWKALARGVVRVMIPKLGNRLIFPSGIEEAIAKLVKAGSPETPTADELRRDVRALYAALDPTVAHDG